MAQQMAQQMAHPMELPMERRWERSMALLLAQLKGWQTESKTALQTAQWMELQRAWQMGQQKAPLMAHCSGQQTPEAARAQREGRKAG